MLREAIPLTLGVPAAWRDDVRFWGGAENGRIAGFAFSSNLCEEATLKIEH